MSFTSEVLTGLAELLDAEGVGVWITAGVYPANTTGIVPGRLPLSPKTAIGLTPYAISGGSWLVSTLGVQIRFRAVTAAEVFDMQDAVFDALDHRGLTIIGGHVITDMWRQTSTPIGSLGSSDLPELADSYYLVTDR